MNFLDLQNSVAFWLDDLQFNYFTTTQVKSWLNRAQQEAQKNLILSGNLNYMIQVQTVLVLNQPDYELPLDFLKTHRVDIIIDGTFPNQNTTLLTPITPNTQDLVMFQSGCPQAYYLKKNKIILMPPPDTVYTMNLYYSYRVTDMVNDNDVPDFPSEYHEYIAVLAAYDGIVKDGREPTALAAKTAIYQELMKKSMNERELDAPRQIVVTNDGGFGSLF